MSIEAERQKLVVNLPHNKERLNTERILRAKEEAGRNLLNNPIAFAARLSADRNGGPLEEIFISPVKTMQEMLDIWWEILETVARRESQEQMLAALAQFNDFITYFWLEGVEKGLAMGVVTEQYRAGLVEVLRKNDRDFSSGDEVSLLSLIDVCKKLDITVQPETDDKHNEAAATD